MSLAHPDSHVVEGSPCTTVGKLRSESQHKSAQSAHTQRVEQHSYYCQNHRQQQVRTSGSAGFVCNISAMLYCLLQCTMLLALQTLFSSQLIMACVFSILTRKLIDLHRTSAHDKLNAAVALAKEQIFKQMHRWTHKLDLEFILISSF